MPIILLVFEILVLMPIPLFIAGKSVGLPIRYMQAVSITLFAGIIGGLAAYGNIYLGIAVFLSVLYYELHVKFHARPDRILIIMLIDFVVAIGIEYVKPFILMSLLGII